MTSPKLTLYSCNYCPFAARAVIAMAETRQEHDKIEVDISTPRPDWYLQEINPFGQVPSLKVDDKHIILESLIVTEYIADLHLESGLLPTDPLQRAQTSYLIQHWGSRTQAAIHKATITRDPVESAKLRQEVMMELEKVDVLLRNAVSDENPTTSFDSEKGSFLFFLGAKFTLADLAIAPFLARFFLISAFQKEGTHEEFEKSLQENPKVQRFLEWRDAILQRPSLQKATPAKDVLVNVYRKFLPKESN
ncbi:hypothetical protein BGZ65_006649 [Modicella reniformis]|uniref:Glutathione S-transferase n=1 Tax=Modicella reniformis TaxID=1440133 RepID=A0A9P6IWE8_9FUNG|nr:hypothetical protein BGZ65_006649 [Modicella reniformis]